MVTNERNSGTGTLRGKEGSTETLTDTWFSVQVVLERV